MTEREAVERGPTRLRPARWCRCRHAFLVAFFASSRHAPSLLQCAPGYTAPKRVLPSARPRAGPVHHARCEPSLAAASQTRLMKSHTTLPPPSSTSMPVLRAKDLSCLNLHAESPLMQLHMSAIFPQWSLPTLSNDGKSWRERRQF